TGVLDANNGTSVWQVNTNDCQMPKVNFVFPTFGGPWTTSEFFPKCFTGVVGPGADPNGFSSIKSIRTYRRGACRTTVKIQDVVDQIVSALRDGVTNDPAITKEPACTDVNLTSFDSVSYLTHHSIDQPDHGDLGD